MEIHTEHWLITLSSGWGREKRVSAHHFSADRIHLVRYTCHRVLVFGINVETDKPAPVWRTFKIHRFITILIVRRVTMSCIRKPFDIRTHGRARASALTHRHVERAAFNWVHDTLNARRYWMAHSSQARECWTMNHERAPCRRWFCVCKTRN